MENIYNGEEGCLEERRDKLEVFSPIKHSLSRKLEVENEIISLGAPWNVTDKTRFIKERHFYSSF